MADKVESQGKGNLEGAAVRVLVWQTQGGTYSTLLLLNKVAGELRPERQG